MVKQLRAGGTPVLLVDGGDCLSSSLPRRANEYRIRQFVEKAKVIIASYNHMGYHGLAVGDTELGLGIARLKELEKQMTFPLLCANLVDAKTGLPVFKPSAVTTVGGVKIGLFGVIMNTLNEQWLQRVAPGVKLTDAVTAGRKVAAALRSKVDLVVGLCHANDDENRRILTESSDVDVVVDPNCHNGSHTLWVEEEKYLGWINGRPVLRCDAQGSRFGRLDIVMGETGKPFVSWAAFQEAYEKKEGGTTLSAEDEQILRDAERRHLAGIQVIPIYPHFAEAPEIRAMVNAFKRSTRFARVDLAGEVQKAKEQYLAAESCKECHEENYKKWRMTLHGKAYSTLVKTGDEYRYDCLPCHTLGYGETFLDAHKVGPYKDVQCENCHGTNPEHADDPEEHRWPTIKEIQCLVCHNPQHLGEPFDFKEMRTKDTCCTVK